LKSVAGQAGVDFFPSAVGEKPETIAVNAIDWAKRHYHDVLLVDTAGRLAIDEEMMAEIKRLHAAINPIETLFVVDAMLGQDAVNTAKAFNEALPLTGVVLTKLDGDARGGAALSVRHITGKPIKFAGVGEKLTGLEAFHPERMASRILGMGDVLSLIEEARKGLDEEKAVAFAKKLKSGKGFDLNDFKEQIAQMRNMGGLTSLMDKMPAQIAQMAGSLPAGAEGKIIGRVEGIINSMTPQERAKPELIKASRKRRIATGAGVQVQEVNRLLNQFEQTQKMMKQFSKGGIGKLMRGMKGMLPGMGGMGR
jgi:signal recognition particle subunit SRP54